MGLLKEFKTFAMKGNVIDLAVGIIIGAAFGKIISSLVADIIMPAIGIIAGGVNFTELSVNIPSMQEGVEPIMLKYGNFIQVTFDFAIIAFAIFMLVKLINSVKKKEEASTPPPVISKEEELLTEIRDLLKKK